MKTIWDWKGILRHIHVLYARFFSLVNFINLLYFPIFVPQQATNWRVFQTNQVVTTVASSCHKLQTCGQPFIQCKKPPQNYESCSVNSIVTDGHSELMHRFCITWCLTSFFLLQLEYEKKKKEAGKRARADKQQVLDMLFSAFEKHQYYNIKDLVDITKQPVVRLRHHQPKVKENKTKHLIDLFFPPPPFPRVTWKKFCTILEPTMSKELIRIRGSSRQNTDIIKERRRRMSSSLL